MRKETDVHEETRQGHLTPGRMASAILRSLVIAVATTAVGLLVGWGILRFMPVDESCSGDLPCFPDLLPVALAVLAVPVVMAIVGPLVARLLRFPWPRFFALAAAWPMALACVGLEAADSHTWPFTDAVSLLLIMLIPYPLIGLWILRLARE